jgi:23S rRNA (adenine2503-C2)-methyltransferase
MTDLSQAERDRLAKIGAPFSTRIGQRLIAPDGTIKLEVLLSDGQVVECVLLRDNEGRGTACISSQVGCPMACSFCKTGSLGCSRNLRVSEIVEQFYHLKGEASEISNIVFMGMGEPLLNLSEVRRAIEVLHHPDGLNIGLRKITISTSGIVKGIRDLAERGPAVRLAVSLPSADPAIRAKIMSVASESSLADLKAALKEYQGATGDRITIESVILGGVNDGEEDAEKLLRFCQGIKVQFNVIPWNPIPDFPFIEPKRERVAAFEAYLEAHGQTVTQRAKRGRAVAGACGQLGSVKKTKADADESDAGPENP